MESLMRQSSHCWVPHSCAGSGAYRLIPPVFKLQKQQQNIHGKGSCQVSAHFHSYHMCMLLSQGEVRGGSGVPSQLLPVHASATGGEPLAAAASK